MKEKIMTTTSTRDTQLQAKLLLAQRVDGDRLMLSDAVLMRAIDGSRPLGSAESLALQQSPLTVRRFQHLATARRASVVHASDLAANEPVWRGSAGLLRAASGSAALTELVTDDGFWTLHFLPHDGGWQTILTLAAGAPFAARLLREQPMLRVVDGAGAIVLQGRLDTDGEYEGAWRFDAAPGPHFQQFGAAFAVEPVLA
jgi:hypothetical protein